MTVRGQVIIIANFDLFAKLSEHKKERKRNKSVKYGYEIDRNRSNLLNSRYNEYYGLGLMTAHCMLS